jgi:RHS repeat-associated protein
LSPILFSKPLGIIKKSKIDPTNGGLVNQPTTTPRHAYHRNNNRPTVKTGSATGPTESSFTYDEGRMTSQTSSLPGQTKTITWTQKGQAKTISPAGKPASTYGYDPMDLKVARTGGAGNRDYYLEGEHLEAEYSGANLQARYFRGSSTDELLASWVLDASGKDTPSIYLHNHLNSVTTTTQADGTPSQIQRFSAFGQQQTLPGTTSATTTNRLMYTGRELDDDSGLYYYRARWYDPSTGRFISEDPIGFQGGVNLYGYVGNNPLNANDASGLVESNLIPGYGQIKAAYKWFTANKDREAQITVGVSGILGGGFPVGIPAGFVGGGANIGFTSRGQFFVQGVATGSLGVGMFGGIGVQGGTSYSNAPTPSGMSVAQSFQSDFNFGAGTVYGGSFQIAQDGGTGLGAAPPGRLGRVGLGAGLQISAGITQTVTYATPPLFGNSQQTIGISSQPTTPAQWNLPSNFSFNDYIGGAAAGGHVLYPNNPGNNTAISVYKK